MDNYTSDSSDSDNPTKTLDFSYLSLDSDAVKERLGSIKDPESVETILLHQNQLNHAPGNITKFTNLHLLDLSNCGLSELPDFLSDCPLTTLVAKNNNLSNDSLPKTFEAFSTLRELNLSGNRLTEFPEQVLQLTALRYLYLGGNGISRITKDIWKLQRLQILSMGGNSLTDVPSTLGQLTTLHALILCDNMLESLPGSIANLKNLKSLLLHKNRLKTLPTEIITLSCLTELSLRDNPLVVRFVSDMTHDPPSLLELAARVIKINNIHYGKEDLPKNLTDYLNSGHCCVNPNCKGVFFNNRIEHIKFVDFCGKYRVPLLQYLCSSKCIDPRSNDDNIDSNGVMMRKVLLG
ncbi:leucine-rich repeat-containing protein 58 [Neodiprion virginianus]|uniref:leucine-rich repeat-containing protein 58 n=1 Tax=Neodiprion fabricii TaxID=2872261 RepID=UPI001ED97509|nr:leucine-rich repeat-containing protein 58 [Neodiprion fabricii]XP_046431400.1 leucine-rich repeat-containing protein 58 [Neodiprion fabricii]XP_046431402.1 leucine-rich repeat-containing protein 58 [Neodiprion fabricii]XP_046625184.1 leucine-rich repeat-containing protein 58 [Neodiprion virginianus]XP_046625185.1 leucine-rich repeat-containing protein 58 [Neodiprion virginianus]XP_046625186.1 leucine-rich repeat-containing protein 58 [Neodiprion virginianus]